MGSNKATAVAPPWRKRMRELLIAGGTIAAAGCGNASDQGGAGNQAGTGNLTGGGGSGGVPMVGGSGGTVAVGGSGVSNVDGSGGRVAVGGSGGMSMVDGSGGMTMVDGSGGMSMVDGSGGSNGPFIPCGNASPDPCICDRPKIDPAAKIACDTKMACEADGGIYTSGNGGCTAADAGAKTDAGP